MSLADKPICAPAAQKKIKTHVLVFTEDKKSSKTFLEKCLQQTDGSVSLKVIGSGKHTMDLVKEATEQLPVLEKDLAKRMERVNKFTSGKQNKEKGKQKKKKKTAKRIQFDDVWLVFDRDDHPDFDKAVSETKRLGFKEGWSNVCFELWYYLYGHTLDPAELEMGVRREDIFTFLTNKYQLKERFDKKYEKLKGDAGLEFHNEMAHDIPSMRRAYQQSIALEKNVRLSAKQPSLRNPYTFVHKLIAQLIPETAHPDVTRKEEAIML